MTFFQLTRRGHAPQASGPGRSHKGTWRSPSGVRPPGRSDGRGSFSDGLLAISRWGSPLAQLIVAILLVRQGEWTALAFILPGLLSATALALHTAGRVGGPPRPPGGQGSVGRGTGRLAGDEGPGQVRDEGGSQPPAVSLETLLLHWEDSEGTSQWGAGRQARHKRTLGEAPTWQQVVRNWSLSDLRSRPKCPKGVLCADSYEVPIGSLPGGGTFAIDLPVDGPHALVAGTTGSGKSILLQTWCLSLACRLSPLKLNFVLLDFKGGSGFNRLADLPHTVGCVNDLDLDHAVRALRGIEEELKRREGLVAAGGAADASELDEPPPRLFVIIDEFQSLRRQLPEYLEHLVQLASQGRSLGMNLIACTQQPMGQIGSQMKANMNLNLCLRVRDPLQSRELLGSDCAALLSPSIPGVGFCDRGEGPILFRCARSSDPACLIRQINRAMRFEGLPRPAKLFSAPLPSKLPTLQAYPAASCSGWTDLPRLPADQAPTITLGLQDDGIRLRPCHLTLRGNMTLIGGQGRGKSNLIALVGKALKGAHRSPEAGGTPRLPLAVTELHAGGHSTRTWNLEGDRGKADPLQEGRRRGSRPAGRPGYDGPPPEGREGPGAEVPAGPPPLVSGLIWLVDDGDDLLDPMNREATAIRLEEALNRQDVTVIIALDSPAALRRAERYGTKIVFPYGERGADLAAGIPASHLRSSRLAQAGIPGRCILIQNGHAQIVQCFPSG